jgi:phosphoribosylanthranilate isomerase
MKRRCVAIKFCGMTRRADLEAALRLGVQYVGLIFAPGGARALTPEQGAQLLAGLDRHGTIVVGVFRDQPARFVNEVVARCGLGLVQLHGREPRDFPAALRVPVLRSVRVAAAGARGGSVAANPSRATSPAAAIRVGEAVPLAPNVFAALLDPEDAQGASGGLGIAAEPAAIAAALARLSPGTRFFLSGGLTPDNVAGAARLWKPFAVDVASGIEQVPGIKDPRRMAAFVAALEVGS